MNNNMVFRIISEFENAAERDYLNEFLKFVGFFTYYDTLENNSNENWYRHLSSSENNGGVDIVINYYGNELYTNAKNKIYLYFDFDSLICGVSHKPLKHKEDAINKFHADSKMIMRRKILEDLILTFPQNISEQLLTVIDAYAPQDGSYNLYLATQIAYGLSVLVCKETKKDKEAQISRICFSKYLETILLNLQNSYQVLEKANNSQNIYGLYGQIQIEHIRRMIVNFISPLQINENCKITSETVINEKLKRIHELDPMWISYFLCEASLSSYYNDKEDCYLRALNIIPDIDRNKIAYASILYEYGKLIEERDKEKAIMLYEKAYKNNPTDYRALVAKTRLELLTNKIGTEGARGKSRTALNQIFSNHSIIGNDNVENYQVWKNLSLTDTFYVWRISIFVGKLDIADGKEYTVKIDAQFATIAAIYFENGGLISKVYDNSEEEIKNFLNYHQSSAYTWVLWKILEPWSNCCQDYFVTPIVNNHLHAYTLEETSDNTQKRKKLII